MPLQFHRHIRVFPDGKKGVFPEYLKGVVLKILARDPSSFVPSSFS